MSKKSVHIVLIEDDSWLRDLFQVTLERAGWHVTSVGSAFEAVDALDERKPDAVVLDVFLPGSNGLQLLHEMRSHADLGNIPVVLVTSSAEYFTFDDMTRYGVVRVLDKVTLQPRELVAAVKKAIV
ncbi:MAG TPA: response regulator [Candidatus Saccharimonadaceae bacterium]|nr:response regulator [Candidatus Saccharimonadaceae bacterium]